MWERAFTGRAAGATIYRAGNLVVDVEGRRARLASELLMLSRQEFDLLVILLKRQNLIMPHTTICQALWGSAGSKEIKRLGVVVSNLREKLASLSPYTIATVRARGYGLVLGESSDMTSADPTGMHDWHSHQYTHGWISAQHDEERTYLGMLVHLLPFDPEDEIRVLDIGAGYGALTKLVLDAFPRSSVVVHDYSEPMLVEARMRLAGASDYLSYARGDLMSEGWTRDISGQFDAVISSIAIHNVRYAERIRAVYRDIYSMLVPGGCFYNVDYVTPPGDMVAKARRHALLMDHRFRLRMETGQWRPLSDVESQIAIKPPVPTVTRGEELNEPASLANQLRWLEEAGFSQAECFWHDGRRALMGAFKD